MSDPSPGGESHAHSRADGNQNGTPDAGAARASRQGRPPHGAALQPRHLRAGPQASGPGRSAGAPGADPSAGTGQDPLWAHARLALHLLPRRCADHGQRPLPHAMLRPDRPVLRRRPPLELRRLRIAGAQAGLRHQRLRRDPPRPVGVGCQAPGGEHVDRRPGSGIPRQGSGAGRAGDRRAVPHRAGRLRRDEQPGGLVRTSGRRIDALRTCRPVQAQGDQAHREDAGQGAHARQHAGILEADPHGRRRTADRTRPAADRADRRPGGGPQPR